MLHPCIGYVAIFYLFMCFCVVPACVMFGCILHELVLKMNVENMHGEKTKKETVCSPEMLLLSYRTTIWCHNLKDHNMYLHLCNTTYFTIRYLFYSTQRTRTAFVCSSFPTEYVHMCKYYCKGKHTLLLCVKKI